jgi:hypothetical protein
VRRYCGGVKWAAPDKSPDLGNSSPAPRVLMYIASLQTSVRYYHQEDDRIQPGRELGGRGQRLGGQGRDKRTTYGMKGLL